MLRVAHLEEALTLSAADIAVASSYTRGQRSGGEADGGDDDDDQAKRKTLQEKATMHVVARQTGCHKLPVALAASSTGNSRAGSSAAIPGQNEIGNLSTRIRSRVDSAR